MTDDKTSLPADPDPNPAPPAARQIQVGDLVRTHNGMPFRGSYDAVMGKVVDISYGAASHRPMPHDVMTIHAQRPAQYTALRDELVLIEGEETSPPAADAPKDQEASELEALSAKLRAQGLEIGRGLISFDAAHLRQHLDKINGEEQVRGAGYALIVVIDTLVELGERNKQEIASLNDVIASLNAEAARLIERDAEHEDARRSLRQEVQDFLKGMNEETDRANKNAAYAEQLRAERDHAKLLAATRLEEIVDLRETIEQGRRYADGLSRENEETHERWGKACVTSEDQRERADVWQRSTQDALSQVAELRSVLKGERERNANLERALESQYQDTKRHQGQLTMLLRGLDEGASIKANDASRLFCLPIVNHKGEHRVMRLLASSCRLHHEKDTRHPSSGPKITGYDVDRQALRTVEIEQLRKSDS